VLGRSDRPRRAVSSMQGLAYVQEEQRHLTHYLHKPWQ
jgi:hypothetical protein